MAELVYTRVSTDEQSTLRQTHLLTEAGLVDGAQGVRLFADPATSSKIPALDRDGFRRLAGYARHGDRLTVSELYRLCRDLADILAVRDWCQQHGVKLRVLSGALSGITDLAAADATTGGDDPGPIRIEMPGKIARHLTGQTTDLGETERHALQQGREIRRGQGYSLHVTAPLHVHQALLAAAETVEKSASAGDRKAYRIYRDRLQNATT